MTLSDRLRRVIRINCDSIQDFAKSIDVSESSVHKWLSGQVVPRKAKLEKISHTYNISMEWLEYGIEDVKEDDPNNTTCALCPEKDRKISDLEKRISDKEEVISSLRDQLQLYREKLGECEDLSKQA